MKTAIIDYGAGNTKSVMNLMDRLQCQYILTSDKTEINSSDRIILPGVGHAKHAMLSLVETGLIPLLKSWKKPFLGICLGMQLMYDFSEEGETDCLGLVPGKIRRFLPTLEEKVPHMGWNTIDLKGNNLLFDGLSENEYMYFVHSYFAGIDHNTIGVCEYLHSFSASMQFDNFYGVQFHPEKSGLAGQKVIENFIRKIK